MVITSKHLRTGAELLLVAIILLLILRPKACSRRGGEVTERGTADSTFYWKNKYNEEVASQRGTAAQFALQDARIKHILDSTAKVYDTKNKRIQELIIAVSRGVSNLQPDGPVIVDIDTTPPVVIPGCPTCPPRIKNLQQTFRNPYYVATVQIGDSSYHRLVHTDTLTVLWKDVKTGGLFNRKKYLQLDINHADTAQKIVGLTSYRRAVPTKEWGIGPEARILYLGGEVWPMGGLNVSRQTGRWNLSLSGGYTGNSIAQPWYGETKVIYKLIRL